MPDRVALPLLALLALGLIGLALVWPQGLGRRSPGPFGHAIAQPPPSRTPAAKPPAAKPVSQAEAPSPSPLRGELPTIEPRP